MPDTPHFPLRSADLRRQFDARAGRIDGHDAIVREAEQRMVERLGMIRHPVARLLDLGCGTGAARRALARRFRGAHWVGVDVSEGMLRADHGRRGWHWPWLLRGAKPSWVCAEAGQLPFADASFDLVFSNLMLHWHPAPHRVFPELARVLRTGGLLFFSSFGPDTLRELRAAALASLPRARPLDYVDMHDFGDMMMAAGFADPVMEVDRLQLRFAGSAGLLAEVRRLGGNPRADRAPGLPGGAQARALHAAIESRREPDGRIGLSFELAFGHGWKAPPRPPRGKAIIAPPQPHRGAPGRTA